MQFGGKAKRKIHARYPFLGGGTYQPPVLSVLYLQVGYQPVAAGKSRVIYAGPTRFPYPLSDNYRRGLTRCLYPLCLMNTKEGCLTPPSTLRIWQNVGDLRGKKVWYILPVPGRISENMGTHIFFKKGVPHTTRQLRGLWKTWAPSVDFFYGHNPWMGKFYFKSFSLQNSWF